MIVNSFLIFSENVLSFFVRPVFLVVNFHIKTANYLALMCITQTQGMSTSNVFVHYGLVMCLFHINTRFVQTTCIISILRSRDCIILL